MILAELHNAKSGWLALRPKAYDVAFRDFMRSMPGAVWRSADKTYMVPDDLWPVMRFLISHSRIAAVQDFTSGPRLNAMPLEAHEGLHMYQDMGIHWIEGTAAQTGAALLADEPGLGKTVQSLMALRDTLAKRTLIVCPAVVVPHWGNQIAEWLGKTSLRLNKKNIDSWADGFGIVSYDTMRNIHKLLPTCQAVILDEIHYASNSRAGRSKALAEYLNRCRAFGLSHVIGLSGTPMLVRPRDLWHPLNLLWPERFGTWWQFTRRYCDGHKEEIPGVGEVWVCDGASYLDELKTRLSYLMIRRTRSECLELPDRVRTVIPVALPAKVLKGLQETAKYLPPEGQELSKLLQSVEPHKLEAAASLAKDLIDQGQRPLILTMRRKSAEELGKELDCPWVTGETAAEKRRDILLSGTGPAVATIYSVTTGIDLTAFNALIIVGLDWVPSTLLQAEARIYRIGQHAPVNIFYLCAEHSIDEVIRSRVIERLGMFDEAIGNAPEETALAGSLSESEEDLIAGIVAAVKKGL